MKIPDIRNKEKTICQNSIEPNIAPMLNEPVSPIKIFAGYLLH